MEPEKEQMTKEEMFRMVCARSRDSLIDFEIAMNPRYEPNWHHDLMAKELENIERNGDKDFKILMVSMPPRSGKSELCSIGFPAWYLGRNPEKEIITVSYSQELAQDFGGKTKGMVESEAYKVIFPNVVLKADEQAKARWRTNKGGSYTSVGVGGALSGRGANILLIDDPTRNREEAESELIRQKTWDFFTSTAFTRLEPGGVVIIIMTRWHVDDLAGRVLANEELRKRCKVISLPAIATESNKYRDIGQALWPNRFPLDKLEEIRTAIGPYDFASLYQGNPILTENQEFNPKWFKYIDDTELYVKNTRNFLTIDTAISKKASADFTGFVDNSVDKENFWNIKAWHQKLSPAELVDTIFALYTQRRYEVIGIERTAYTDGLKPYLDMEQRKRGVFLPIIELSHEQIKKEVRIRGLIPRYASGSIFHVKGQTDEMERELMDFPKGLHDDIIDALSYQLQVADSPSIAAGSIASVFLPVGDW